MTLQVLATLVTLSLAAAADHLPEAPRTLDAVTALATFPYTPPVTYPGGPGFPKFCSPFGSYTIPATCTTPNMEPAGNFQKWDIYLTQVDAR